MCVKSKNGQEVNKKKMNDIVTKNGVQVTRFSVDKKTNDLYVDLPTEANKNKLLPLLNDSCLKENEIVNVKQKLPVITIRNIEDYQDQSDLVKKIGTQNPNLKDLIEKGSDFKVLFSKSSNIESEDGEDLALSNVVIKVSNEIREEIAKNGNRIFIGLSSHRVTDRFYVKICAKCHKYGHYHEDCSNRKCCGYCSSEEHDSSNCAFYKDRKVNEYKCVNCEEAGKPFNGHSSHWKKCPTFIEKENQVKNSIPYYSKN